MRVSAREDLSSDRGEFISRISWTLSIASLLLTVVGFFYLRLWLLGLLFGITAFAVSFMGLRRKRNQKWYANMRTVVALFAIIVPMFPVVTVAFKLISSYEAVPQPEKLHVELLAEADGDFVVTYTGPVDSRESEVETNRVDATDLFEASFDTTINSINFYAVVPETNRGQKQLSCKVKINDVVVFQRVVDDRQIVCTVDLQDLYKEQVSLESP